MISVYDGKLVRQTCVQYKFRVDGNLIYFGRNNEVYLAVVEVLSTRAAFSYESKVNMEVRLVSTGVIVFLR